MESDSKTEQREKFLLRSERLQRHIKLNVLPFVLAPGVAAWGYFLGGGTGTILAMGCWAATVSIATLIVLGREARRRRREGDLD